MNARKMSRQTLSNWAVDASLALGGVAAMLSGVYFLFLPVGGRQGGRNALYGVTILFSRHTWSDLHIWSGVIMIAAAIVHIAIHWRWIASMSKRVVRDLLGRPPFMNNRGRFNVLVDAMVAISFLVTAVSGVVLLFVPAASGGRLATDPLFLVSRTTWDLLHTWAGVALAVAVIVHLAIHWGWIVKVTKNVAGWAPGLRTHPQSDVAQA